MMIILVMMTIILTIGIIIFTIVIFIVFNIIIAIDITFIYNLDGATSQPWIMLLRSRLLQFVLQIQAACCCSAPLQLAASPGNCAL